MITKFFKFKPGDWVELTTKDAVNNVTGEKASFDTVGVIDEVGPRVDGNNTYLLRFYEPDGKVSTYHTIESDLEFLMPSKPYRMRSKYIPGVEVPLTDDRVSEILKQVLKAKAKFEAKPEIRVGEKKVTRWGPVRKYEPVNQEVFKTPPLGVDDDAHVQVHLKSGHVMVGRANQFNWGLTYLPSDRIEHYRIRLDS